MRHGDLSPQPFQHNPNLVLCPEFSPRSPSDLRHHISRHVSSFLYGPSPLSGADRYVKTRNGPLSTSPTLHQKFPIPTPIFADVEHSRVSLLGRKPEAISHSLRMDIAGHA